MKVLFITAKEATDHLASCLWDGLQEILGWESVYDVVGHRLLCCSTSGEMTYEGGSTPEERFGEMDVLSSISARRFGKMLSHTVHENARFSLLVINAAFLREYSWEWCRRFRELLTSDGKIVYVEGWDAAWEVHPPEIHVDAVFRKEIDPGYMGHYVAAYGMEPKHLTFAAPARWFSEEDLHTPRPFDVFYSGTTHSNTMRWACLAGVYQSRKRHQSVIASNRIGASVADYFGYYRKSKLALCPASAERADSLRTYEAVACGAIPLFVGYPPWTRENWFDGKVFQCDTPEGVASHIDAALDRDLPAMRKELWEHARKYHTTRARAEKVLQSVGMMP